MRRSRLRLAMAPSRPCFPIPHGADISVAVVGEQPITLKAKVRDLLIVGMGDSFASGEGNPDMPAEFSEAQRHKNLYPRRKNNDASGSALWTDELCHRSLYGHQLRAALQIAIENPQSAVTFLGYACSGAGIEAGILGPQEYVESVSTTGRSSDAAAAPSRFLSGDSKDAQIRWLLRELCTVKPKEDDGLWVCPDNQFRRPVDYLFLSVGGNDIGFRNVVAWATLRERNFRHPGQIPWRNRFGKRVCQKHEGQFPGAYARLAKAIERAVPLYSDEQGFDASRVILTAYPDMLVDETGEICPAGGKEDGEEDRYPANQSLDGFSSWLATTSGRLNAVHEQLATLDRRMKDLSGDHGWTYAGRVYNDRVFQGHGFCAQRSKFADDPAEVLMIPCWGKADRPTQTCQSSWSGKAREWRPYSPITQNYPYALAPALGAHLQ